MLNDLVRIQFQPSHKFFRARSQGCTTRTPAARTALPTGSCVGLGNEINTLLVVPTFRLLVFRSDRLERWGEFDAPDAVSAIQQAAQQEREGVVELWSEQGKLATLRPVGRHH